MEKVLKLQVLSLTDLRAGINTRPFMLSKYGMKPAVIEDTAKESFGPLFMYTMPT
jgi:hypothetical protein